MYIKPSQKKILWAFVASLLFFVALFTYQKNYEFIGYVAVVLLLLFVLLKSNKYVEYPDKVLWLLLVWAILHMLGGVEAGGSVIYTHMIFPIVGEPYNILKYDQVVHAFGFFVATLAIYYVLKPHLKEKFGWVGVGVVLVMAGLGLGALNEIIEFLMTVFLPDTNVGGYENTALDLVFNLIGALLAVWTIRKVDNSLVKKEQKEL